MHVKVTSVALSWLGLLILKIVVWATCSVKQASVRKEFDIKQIRDAKSFLFLWLLPSAASLVRTGSLVTYVRRAGCVKEQLCYTCSWGMPPAEDRLFLWRSDVCSTGCIICDGTDTVTLWHPVSRSFKHSFNGSHSPFLSLICLS